MNNLENDVEKGSVLKRGLSLWDAALFGIGGAVGSGILFAAAGGTAYAGPAVILSWIIAAMIIAIVTVPYAEFSSMASRAGVSARIGYYSYGKLGGFLGGWALFLWAVIIPPIEAVAVSEYSAVYYPALYNPSLGVLTTEGVAVSILITIGFVLLNLTGVSNFGKFNSGLTIIKILNVVILIVIVPLLLFKAANFTTTSFLPSTGFQGVLIAIPATGILFSFGGYRQVADMAGEIKNPKRNLPLAIGITLVVQSVMYILMSIVVVGAVVWSQIPNAKTGAIGVTPGSWGNVAGLSSPLADLMKYGANSLTGTPVAILGVLFVLAILFAIYSPLGTFGVYLTGSSRIIFGFTREGALPMFLGNTNKKGVPVYAIVLAAIVGDVFLFPLPSWESLADFVSVAASINFAVIAASLPILRKLHPDVERPFKVPFAKVWSLIAFVLSTLLVYWATYPVTLYAVAAFLVGIIVFLYQAFKEHFSGLGIVHSIWIPLYVIGLLMLSYYGSALTGGNNLLVYPYDLYAVVGYAVLFWFISQVSSPNKKVGDLEGMIARAPKEESKAQEQ